LLNKISRILTLVVENAEKYINEKVEIRPFIPSPLAGFG
jgi:hypothetical protein